jgi:hypothetical protein
VGGKKYTLDHPNQWKNEQGELLDDADPDLKDFLGGLEWPGINYDPAKLKERLEERIEALRKRGRDSSDKPVEFSPNEEKSYIDDLIADYERQIELADNTVVESGEEVTEEGQVYSLKVPDSDDLLDWDKPLSEQPEKVKTIIKSLTTPEITRYINELKYELNLLHLLENGAENTITGEMFYHALSATLGSNKAASESLNSSGIPGLQYLDGFSRADGEGTHNFVIWNEERMSVEETYYQFVGEHAKTADRLQLGEAQKMAEAGDDNETIRKKTGWFKSMDNKWRFEIPDNLDGINFDVDWTNDVTLEQIYNNEPLYRAYPDMKEVQVFLIKGRSMEGKIASYSAMANEITLYEITEQTKRALVHETQHVIQHIEGFAKGGSIINAYPIDGKSGAWDMLKKRRQSILTPMSVEEYAESAGFKNSEDAQFSYKEYLREHRKRFKKGIPADLDLSLQKNVAMDHYENLAGEIEARDTARRTWLSEDEKQDISPNLPGSAIIVFDGKEVASYQAEEERVVKASTTFLDGETIIKLFQVADRSSFLHEMGHFFLESRRRISLLDDIPQQVRDDWKTVTNWLEVSDLDFSKPLQGKDADRWQTAQEKWAAGFEQYLMEGKAPTPELKHAFEDFKEWLSEIYQSVKNIFFIDSEGERRPVEINDEIRGVMARILTDDKEQTGEALSSEKSERKKENETPPAVAPEIHLQRGQKVNFKLAGSGKGLSGSLIEIDEMTVTIDTNGNKLKFKRENGTLELCPDTVRADITENGSQQQSVTLKQKGKDSGIDR